MNRRLTLLVSHLIDLGLTANLGAKFVRPVSDVVSVAVGARYFSFFGSSLVEQQVKSRESTIGRFNLAFNGLTAFAGTTLRTHVGQLSFQSSRR